MYMCYGKNMLYLSRFRFQHAIKYRKKLYKNNTAFTEDKILKISNCLLEVSKIYYLPPQGKI